MKAVILPYEQKQNSYNSNNFKIYFTTSFIIL